MAEDLEQSDLHGPTLRGDGAAWPEPPEPLPPAPEWINGRAFPAVWREMLTFAVGGLNASVSRFPQMRPARPWQHRPEPESETDIDQAIAAKLHLALRTMPLLAESEVVLIEPGLIELLPEWEAGEEAAYAAAAELPSSPLFLDFESQDGIPAGWEQSTWPLPLNLRGALCWQTEQLLCVVPFGSVGGVHPWGGNDYQCWARWMFVQGERAEWPEPGPGDFLARASGDVIAWVDPEQESICAHQGAVAFNLCRRALSALMALEAVGGELEAEHLTRPMRRRAAREGQRIALRPKGFPELATHTANANAENEPELAGAPCVADAPHRRLEQAHRLWHEALEAYDDPDAFVTKFNATLQAFRTVTWVVQKEFGGERSDELTRWYPPWRELLKDDPRMSWALDARNEIEHQGDLRTESVAAVRVVAGWHPAPIAELAVDPTETADEIARRLLLTSLPQHVREAGVLEVERRWTLPALPGDELLDVLAHCYGVLSRVVAAAHEQRGQQLDECELGHDLPCAGSRQPAHPSGRLPCMLATREARTRRRNLGTGVPYGVELQRIPSREIDPQAIRARYGIDQQRLPAPDAPLVERGAGLHDFGKRVLAADGYHRTLTWLLRGQERVLQTTLNPEDARDKRMMMDRLALDADRFGADEILFTTEAWQALVLPEDDPRSELPPAEREDRVEVLMTYAMTRGGPCHTWSTQFTHAADGAVQLGETEHIQGDPPPFLNPLLDVWARWPDP